MDTDSENEDEGAPKPRWEKVLWRKQPYPDNYVDNQRFLEQLIQNANVEIFGYWESVKASGVITQQLCIVSLFVVIFKHLWDGVLSLRFMLCLDATLFSVWVIWTIILNPRVEVLGLFRAARSVALFLIVLLLLSPVMFTMTRTYSNDTMWATAIVLLSVHFVCNDYAYLSGQSDKHTGAVSTNAAIFSSVLLASRLPSSLHAFSMLALAMILFGLFPSLGHSMMRHGHDASVSVTWLLFGMTVASLAFLLEVLSFLFFTAFLVITFILPKILISMQSAMKMQINGPWDEATPPPTESSQVWRKY